jgi:hypothetical protein
LILRMSWKKHCHLFKNIVMKQSSQVITIYQKGISEQPGIFLVTGALFLKSGSVLQSLTVAAPGYVILYSVCRSYYKKWRDQE